jgi:hypothetical protein
MNQHHLVEGREQVVDTMIDLTRLSNLQRTMIAGGDSMQLYVALKRRGFIRVATPRMCRIPRAQHAIGLVAGRDELGSIENALVEISPFLSDHTTIAILIDSRENGSSLRIRTWLQQMGFQIEAGVRCQRGLVLSAYRRGVSHMERAA